MPAARSRALALSAGLSLALLAPAAEAITTTKEAPVPTITPPTPETQPTPTEITTGVVAQETGWRSFITAAQLKQELERGAALTIIDVRERSAYDAGHIPGAISIPGSQWRTPKARPGEGLGEDVFTRPDGTPDTDRYGTLLSAAGVSRTDDIIVYGKPGGTAEGVVAVFILDLLGAPRVRFVEGVGHDEWLKAGGILSTEPTTRPPTTFTAAPKSDVLWNLDKVLSGIHHAEVVFWDCRTPEEFEGTDLRGNKRGGRIPGSKWLDSRTLLDAENRSISKEELRARLNEVGITPDKTVVIYCQTGTRCTLPYVQLKELGYERVAFYDASWLEYGNRDDTPVEQ